VRPTLILLLQLRVDGDLLGPFPRALDDRAILLVDVIPPCYEILIRLDRDDVRVNTVDVEHPRVLRPKRRRENQDDVPMTAAILVVLGNRLPSLNGRLEVLEKIAYAIVRQILNLDSIRKDHI
jgi:hypothetical protein